MTGHLLGDFAEVEVGSMALHFNLDEVHWFIRRHRVDADHSVPVRHGLTSFAERTSSPAGAAATAQCRAIKE